MKRLILCMLLGWWGTCSVSAQQFTRDTTLTAVQRQVLAEYLMDSELRFPLRPDSAGWVQVGAVYLTEWRDPAGQLNWSVKFILDDRYKQNLPLRYFDFLHTFVLIFDADADGTPRRVVPTADLLRQVDDVVLGRLYQIPPTRVIRRKVRQPNGTLREETYPTQVTPTGNSDHELRVLFRKDGTIQKYKPV